MNVPGEITVTCERKSKKQSSGRQQRRMSAPGSYGTAAFQNDALNAAPVSKTESSRIASANFGMTVSSRSNNSGANAESNRSDPESPFHIRRRVSNSKSIEINHESDRKLSRRHSYAGGVKEGKGSTSVSTSTSGFMERISHRFSLPDEEVPGSQRRPSLSKMSAVWVSEDNLRKSNAVEEIRKRDEEIIYLKHVIKAGQRSISALKEELSLVKRTNRQFAKDTEEQNKEMAHLQERLRISEERNRALGESLKVAAMYSLSKGDASAQSNDDQYSLYSLLNVAGGSEASRETVKHSNGVSILDTICVLEATLSTVEGDATNEESNEDMPVIFGSSNKDEIRQRLERAAFDTRHNNDARHARRASRLKTRLFDMIKEIDETLEQDIDETQQSPSSRDSQQARELGH